MTDAELSAKAAALKNTIGTALILPISMRQVTGHKKMELLMETTNQSGSDSDLRAFATKTLPVVQGDLKMAQQLQAQDKS